MNAKTFSDPAESLIFCPEKRGRIDKDRGYQVCVGQADAKAVQTTSLNRLAALRSIALLAPVEASVESILPAPTSWNVFQFGHGASQ